MKYEIYGELIFPPDPPIRLRLRQDSHDGSVSVVVVAAKGDRIQQGCLVTFMPEGRIRREVLVNPDLGFDLDDTGRIKVREGAL